MSFQEGQSRLGAREAVLGKGGGALAIRQLPVTGPMPGAVLQVEVTLSGPKLTMRIASEASHGIDGLPIARRAIHTLKEGNNYFLRTNSVHGLIALSISGPLVRFTFSDGTWLGDVSREAFFAALADGEELGL